MRFHLRCNRKVVEEKELKEYPFYCPICDENVYRFETYVDKAIKCPYCEGDGMVYDYADDVIGNSMKFTHSCECCDGDGIIPSNEYKLAKDLFPKTNKEIIEQIEKGV